LLVELLLQILGDSGFIILGGRNIESFDHDNGGTITVKTTLHLLPQRCPGGIGQ
jgi:hypothetical protein